MALNPLEKVPAIFKKETEHLLTLDNGPHFEDEKKPYAYQVEDVSDGQVKLGIVKGKQLMIYPAEAYGQTYWHDPNGNQPSIFVGIGHVVLPEHADKSREALIELGYQFHEKRADFEPVYPLEHFQTQEPAKQPEQAKEEEKSVQQLETVLAPPVTPHIIDEVNE